MNSLAQNSGPRNVFYGVGMGLQGSHSLLGAGAGTLRASVGAADHWGRFVPFRGQPEPPYGRTVEASLPLRAAMPSFAGQSPELVGWAPPYLARRGGGRGRSPCLQ